MKRIRYSQSGFSLVEAIVILFIVTALGAAGYLVYKQHHKETPATPTSSNQPAKKQNPPKVATPNPYAGWKQYCDTSISRGCFKYPNDWLLEGATTPLGNSTYVGAYLASPGKATSVSYAFPYVKDGDDFNFLTVSIEDVPSRPGIKVVGGVYTDSNYTQYSIVTAATITRYGLETGKQTKLVNTPRFNLDTSDDYQFTAYPTVSPTSLAEAKNWFTTPDAKTALLILKSFSVQ